MPPAPPANPDRAPHKQKPAAGFLRQAFQFQINRRPRRVALAQKGIVPRAANDGAVLYDSVSRNRSLVIGDIVQGKATHSDNRQCYHRDTRPKLIPRDVPGGPVVSCLHVHVLLGRAYVDRRLHSLFTYHHRSQFAPEPDSKGASSRNRVTAAPRCDQGARMNTAPAVNAGWAVTSPAPTSSINCAKTLRAAIGHSAGATSV